MKDILLEVYAQPVAVIIDRRPSRYCYMDVKVRVYGRKR